MNLAVLTQQPCPYCQQLSKRRHWEDTIPLQVREKKHEELISCYYNAGEHSSSSPTKGAKKQNES